MQPIKIQGEWIVRILVLSDSHGLQYFMQRCVEALQPDAVIHLGDMVRDADKLAAQYPGLRFYQVAGNCDGCRVPPDYPEILIEDFCGLRVFMTHGHRHGVKTFLSKLIADGRQCGAKVILYGHTHVADCRQLEDGCWIMNPGSAGYGPSAGMLEISPAGEIQCKLILPADLEEHK